MKIYLTGYEYRLVRVPFPVEYRLQQSQLYVNRNHRCCAKSNGMVYIITGLKITHAIKSK